MTRRSTLLATAVVAGLAAATLGFSAQASAQGWGMMGGYGPGYQGHMGYGPGYGPGWRHRDGRGYRQGARYRYDRDDGPGPGWAGGGYGYCFGRQGWR